MIFRAVLWTIGAALTIASRNSARLRSQLSRDMTVVIQSSEGVARSYAIRERRIHTRSGVDPQAVCTLRFRTGAVGTGILLARDVIGRIMDGLASGDVECDGEAAIVLWFYELTMGLVPMRRARSKVYPDGYIAPERRGRSANRIIREPAVTELDPGWVEAHAQREKLVIWQVGGGAPVPGKFKRHAIVVDVIERDRKGSL